MDSRARMGVALGLAVLAGVALAKGEDDVAGKVTLGKKKAVKDATVLVSVKSWPGGQFRMRDHDVETDAKGRFTLNGVVTPGGRYGVNVWVVKNGVTLVSNYQWHQTGDAYEPVSLTVETAHPLRVRALDADGKPVKGAKIAPASRMTQGGDVHQLFGQHAGKVAEETDGKGHADAEWFLPGEWVSVNVQLPGAGWQQRHFTVPAEKNAIVDLPATVPPTPDQDLRAGDDEQKRYYLMGPKSGDAEPENGYGLILVVPGGSGDEGFHTWVRERYDDMVGGGFVFAQLVAVNWDESVDITWPTKRNPVKGMAFSFEEFVDAVIDDAAERVKIDPERVYTMSWSSGGPSCYRVASLPDSRVRGSIPVMSVFNRGLCEKLKNAKGRPFWIVHAPGDKQCKIASAKDAERALKKAGAKVEFHEYEGGHGWNDAAIDLVRKGILWVDANR